MCGHFKTQNKRQIQGWNRASQSVNPPLTDHQLVATNKQKKNGQADEWTTEETMAVIEICAVAADAAMERWTGSMAIDSIEAALPQLQSFYGPIQSLYLLAIQLEQQEQQALLLLALNYCSLWFVVSTLDRWIGWIWDKLRTIEG